MGTHNLRWEKVKRMSFVSPQGDAYKEASVYRLITDYEYRTGFYLFRTQRGRPWAIIKEINYEKMYEPFDRRFKNMKEAMSFMETYLALKGACHER